MRHKTISDGGTHSKVIHSARCQECKARVRKLLTKLYDICEVNHSFPWFSTPEAYRGSAVGEILQVVFKSLGHYRGYQEFIKALQMPPCDFYLPRMSLLVEFDESQHFTRARRITLEQYRPEVPVGFSVPQWISLCNTIVAVDDDPPDRDERRAWYDTLRDLLPCIHGFKPTVRVYSEAFRWCTLEVNSKDAVAQFRSLIKGLPEPPAASR